MMASCQATVVATRKVSMVPQLYPFERALELGHYGADLHMVMPAQPTSCLLEYLV